MTSQKPGATDPKLVICLTSRLPHARIGGAKGVRISKLLVVLRFDAVTLVPRTRSSHHNCRETDCELRVQSGTRIIELLVSFDSEVRYGACGKLRRTSESGHEGGHLMNRYYALTIGAAMIFSALPLLGTPVLAADPRVADL